MSLLFSSAETKESGPYFHDVETNRRNGYVTLVNLSEFYYKTCATLVEDTAKLHFYQLRELLQTLETDFELSLSAGREKCHHNGRLSLVDCSALAAARSLNATILTTDAELAKIKDIDAKLIDI